MKGIFIWRQNHGQRNHKKLVWEAPVIFPLSKNCVRLPPSQRQCEKGFFGKNLGLNLDDKYSQ